jgi:hypothetical protein
VAEGAVAADELQKEHFFGRFKFLWQTRASSTKLVYSRDAATDRQGHSLSSHGWQNTSPHDGARARSDSDRAFLDESTTWDYGSLWECSTIFDEIFKTGFGDEWPADNMAVITE